MVRVHPKSNHSIKGVKAHTEDEGEKQKRKFRVGRYFLTSVFRGKFRIIRWHERGSDSEQAKQNLLVARKAYRSTDPKFAVTLCRVDSLARECGLRVVRCGLRSANTPAVGSGSSPAGSCRQVGCRSGLYLGEVERKSTPFPSSCGRNRTRALRGGHL